MVVLAAPQGLEDLSGIEVMCLYLLVLLLGLEVFGFREVHLMLCLVMHPNGLPGLGVCCGHL